MTKQPIEKTRDGLRRYICAELGEPFYRDQLCRALSAQHIKQVVDNVGNIWFKNQLYDTLWRYVALW